MITRIEQLDFIFLNKYRNVKRILVLLAILFSLRACEVMRIGQHIPSVIITVMRAAGRLLYLQRLPGNF